MIDPNNRIVGYMLVTHHVSTVNDMNDEINGLIQEGWEPYGALCLESAIYRQVLVKREPLHDPSKFMQELFTGLMERIDRLELKLDKES